MAMHIDGIEIESSEMHYGFRLINTTDEPIVCDTKEDAELQAMMYLNTEVVQSRVFYSPWVKVS